MLFQEQIKTVKQAAPELAATTNEQRNAALAAVRTALQQHQEEIFEANRQDMEQAEADGVSGPVRKRLKFDEGKLRDVMAGISDLTGMEDPLFQTQFARELDDGLVLKRVTCPIGVIGVIFEARPDALVQISALCIKSGNCAILKGGSEALRTNRTLFDIIHRAVINAGLPADCMMQLEARSEINELLECHDSVDLLIPRGSNAFVQYIMNHTKIPVMGHADGICHIYVDKEADLAKAVPIIVDADALNLLSEELEILKGPHTDLIVTPHLGEMSRLVDMPTEYIKKNILMTAQDFSREYNVICVLKDTRTITSIPYGKTYVNTSGNHGMATAGSGDVLTGIIAGLLAGGLTPEDAAVLGVCVHGLSGDAMVEKTGYYSLMAEDILDGIKEVLK